MIKLGNQKISSLYLGTNKIKKAYLGNDLVFSSYTPPQINIGDIIDFAGYKWIVVNDNGNGTVVLAMQYIYDSTVFGPNSTYAGSTLENITKSYENSFPPDALSQIVSTTVNGVTSKVFVPSQENVNGGYDYFSDDNSRICQKDGRDQIWWTSSSTSDNKLYVVITTGQVLSGRAPNNPAGARLFITIKKS